MNYPQIYEQNSSDIIWRLVSIENDVAKLTAVLKDQPLQKKEMIEKLLQEIETTAIACRKRLVERIIPAVQQNCCYEGVVTEKEVRELLEDFV